MSSSAVGHPRTWQQAFPRWDLVSDYAPVAGSTLVRKCAPEDRTEIVMEAATAFRNAHQQTFEQLYPLVPSSLNIDLGRKYGVRPYSSIAESHVTDIDHRSVQRVALHQTLAQANAAAACEGTGQWSEDEILRGVGSALLGLSPQDFYLVVDVRLRGRQRKFADPYYFDNFGDEVDLALPQALQHASSIAHSTELMRWLAERPAIPSYWRETHPQLGQTFGVLEFTLAHALEALYPDLKIRSDAFGD